jgi:hypothetical protein
VPVMPVVPIVPIVPMVAPVVMVVVIFEGVGGLGNVAAISIADLLDALFERRFLGRRHDACINARRRNGNRRDNDASGGRFEQCGQPLLGLRTNSPSWACMQLSWSEYRRSGHGNRSGKRDPAQTAKRPNSKGGAMGQSSKFGSENEKGLIMSKSIIDERSASFIIDVRSIADPG